MRKRSHIVVSLVLASVTIANADMVKCKEGNGSLYVGPMPPEGCVPVGTLRAQSPTKDGDAGSSWKQGDFRPTPTPAPDTSAQDAAAAKQKEIERRRGITAVAIQNMVIKPYRNGRFFEGTLANGAEFPVYGVRVCIENGQRCQNVAPSTLFPGAQGTFSFEVVGWGTPEWRITWNVVPGESQ